jgi:hypothetical protein
MMKLSNNALALFCFISTTSTVVMNVNGFTIVRPTAPTIPFNTGLGYIKEGYETGIGPDILIGRRSKQQQKKQQDQQQEQDQQQDQDQDQPPQKEDRSRSRSRRPTSTTSSPSSFVVPDGIIDAVVIEEDFYDNDVNDYVNDVNDVNANVIVDDPSSVFPDLYESEKEVLQQQQQQQQQQTTGTSSIWDTTTAKTIQGGSLRTWSMEVPEVDHTQVLMRNSYGYPIRAQLDVYNGPDNVPMKLAVFSTCGLTHPFSCIIPTPGDSKQSIGIKNTGPMEFPIEAVVIADVESVREKQNQQQQQSHQSHQSHQQQQQQGGYGGFYSTVGPTTTMEDSTYKSETSSSSTSTSTTSTTGLGSFVKQLRELGDVRKIDGSSAVAYDGCDGELYEFESNVDSVQVLIEAIGGRSCQARIELAYGDSDEIIQVIELAIEDGRDRPFFAVIDTPAKTNTRTSTTTKIRIVNLDKYSAFPLRACVEPYTISDDDGHDGNDDGNDNYEYGYDYDNNNNYAASDADDTTASTFNYDEHASSTIPDFTIPVASSNPEESFAMY